MKFRHLSTILILLVALPALAGACACTNASPGQCPGLQPTDVVFLGTVTGSELVPPQQQTPDAPAPTQAAPSDSSSTTPTPAPSADPPAAAPAQASATPAADAAAQAPAAPSAPTYVYHFKVDEHFAGPDQPEIDIYSGGDDGDCGYRFRKGDQYIVYTQQEAEGRLFATICNGTRPVSEGAALLPQLRAMRDGKRVASVFGVLRRSDPPFLSPPDDPDDPIPVISLKLRSNIDRFQTNSGPDGVYTFYDVHAGTYDFSANLPSGTELTQKAQNAPLSSFEIPDGACYEYDVYALPTGHLHGSVVGPDGKPLAIASLELYRVGAYDATRPGYWGFQGATGAFDFDHVGPGKYILVYNRPNRRDPNSPYPRAFYPGVFSIDKAKPITLKDGQSLEKINFKVANGYPARSVRVQLKWTGAPPAGEVTVAANADKYENPSLNKIDDALYNFTLFKDANYTVSAWEDLTPQHNPGKGACIIPARIQSDAITVSGADSATKQITLTFPKVTCTKQ